MPSRDRKSLLATREDHEWIMQYALYTDRTAAEVISELVELKKASIVRKDYLRDLRIARSRLGLR